MTEKVKYRLFFTGILAFLALDTYLTTIGW